MFIVPQCLGAGMHRRSTINVAHARFSLGDDAVRVTQSLFLSRLWGEL